MAKPETSSAMSQAQQAHAHGHGEAAGAMTGIKYATPSGWEEVPAGEMRAASFRVKGEGEATADVGVFPLPGMAGGDLGNVNRWRGQVGIEPVSEEELAKITETVEVGDAKGQLYDLAGQTPGLSSKTRILAAIHRREGMAWFFKMTGEDGLVAAQKPAFKEFLKSIQFVEGGGAMASGGGASSGTTPSLPEGHPPIRGESGLPPSHPPISGESGLPPSHPPVINMTSGMASADGSGSAKPVWTVPQGWKEAPAGQFLAAKFQLEGESGAQATVNVSVSSGEGGGVAGNVNRWRGQLGLGVLPADELKLEALQTEVGEATLADLNGTDGHTGTRLIGVVVPQAGKTWFYKLMGDEKIVEREKDAFIQFIKTAKY